MNPDWEKLWEQDLARRGAYVDRALEVHKALVAAYAAKVEEFRQRAEEAGFTADHPLVKAMAASLADLPRIDFSAPEFQLPAITLSPPEIPEPPALPLP